MLWTFINKKYNLPAVNKLYTILRWCCNKVCGKLPETFSETFLSRDELVTTKFIMLLCLQKIQFYDCKQVLDFNKYRKVPLRKFPPEKNPPENVSDNFVKFRKFFRQGEPSENFGKPIYNVLKVYKTYNSITGYNLFFLFDRGSTVYQSTIFWRNLHEKIFWKILYPFQIFFLIELCCITILSKLP